MVEATKEIGFQTFGVQGLEINACGRDRTEVELLRRRSLIITESQSLNQPHRAFWGVTEELGLYTPHSWSSGRGSSLQLNQTLTLLTA